MSRKLQIVLAMLIVLTLAVSACGSSQEGKTVIENRAGQPIAQPTTAIVTQGGQKAEGNTTAGNAVQKPMQVPPAGQTDDSGRKIFTITDSKSWYRAYTEYCGTSSYAELAFWYALAQRSPSTISFEDYAKLQPEQMTGQKYCPRDQNEAVQGASIIRDNCTKDENLFGGWCKKANNILKEKPDMLPASKGR